MKSKIGFHVDIQGHQGQVEKMIRSETRVIKVISSMGMLRDLHDALGDKTIFIARDWKVTDDFLRFRGSDSPQETARRWMEGMRPALVQAPFAYWESFNEMSNWDNIGAYGEFEAERQRLMAAEGFKACIGNFATGTPAVSDQDGDGRDDVWREFYPALRVAHELGNILGLHEYGGLWMDLWYGPNQSDALRSGNRVPFPEDRHEGWLFGRYRKVWRRHIEPNGWTNIRIALTEFGLDMAGTGDTDFLAGYTVGSWSTCGPAWKKLDGRTDAAQFYVDQLKWCDRQMQKDPYILGSTIFTWGTLGSLWQDFEINGEVADKLIDYIATTEGIDPGLPVDTGTTDGTPTTTEPPNYITPIPEQGLRVRSAPTVDAEAVALVHPGDKLQTLEPKATVDAKLGRTNEWLKIKTPSNIEGFVAAWLTVIYTGPVPTQPSGDKLYVTPKVARGVNVISGAAENFKTLATIPLGEVLEVLEPEGEALDKIGKQGTWLKVRTARGINGWVVGDNLVRAFPGTPGGVLQPTEKLILRTTAVEGLRIRSGPSSQHTPLVTVSPADKLEAIGDPAEIRRLLGRQSQWINVRTPDGTTGWAAAWFLEIAPLTFSWPVGHALVGLHGPADIGEWPWDDGAYTVVREGKIEAVKLLAAGDIGGNVITKLKQQGVRFIMARLFAKFPEKKTAAQFVRETADAALRLYDNGVRYFEVHNEPNLHTASAPEGMWVVWQNGKEFGDFYLESVRLLRELMPGAQFGFPGVSPGFDVPNVRANSATFLAQADSAIRQSDFVCMHTYWGPGGKTWQQSANEVTAFCNAYPDKLILVTEFSNPSESVSKDVKALEYSQFYTAARSLPANLGGLFSFVLSASSGFEHETWKGSQISVKVGSRTVA